MKFRLKLAVLVAVSLGIAACGGVRSSTDLRKIRGTDTNGNGVRDDVEAKIRAKFSKDPAKMQGWLQYADALTDVLEAAYLSNIRTLRKEHKELGCYGLAYWCQNIRAIKNANKELGRAMKCTLNNKNDIGQRYDNLMYVQALIINTRLRRDAYMDYSRAIDEGAGIGSRDYKNPCKNNY